MPLLIPYYYKHNYINTLLLDSNTIKANGMLYDTQMHGEIRGKPKQIK